MSRQTKIQTKKLTTANASTSQKDALPEDEPPQVQAQSPAQGLDDTEAIILKVSESFCAIMEERLSKFSETLDKISARLDNHDTRVTAVEQRVSDAEDSVTELSRRLADAEKRIASMASGLDDMENRSRRDNIRIINLKEGTEGTSPLQFFEAWLPSLLGFDKSPGAGAVTRIKMDRAHRGSGRQGTHPRPVIIKLHNSRDKQRIMAAVRAAPELKHDGQRIFIHQDLSLAVRERRRGFNDACRALIGKGIRFNMRYPATLTLKHEGTIHEFYSPKDAQDFIAALN